MKERRSQKHHYLPRYYLKGFTNPDNSFYVYDKKCDEVFSSSPQSTFFENNLNTIISKEGGHDDFLEGLYTEFENKVWNSLDTIRDSKHKESIRNLDKMNLYFFLSVLHWRLPKNMSRVENLSDEFFSTERFNYFKLKSKNGEIISEEERKKLVNSDGFKKSARLIIPFTPFYTKEWSNSINNWSFSYAGDGGNWHMVSDSPIITNGENDRDPEKCLNRFIFPVSSKIILINNGKKVETKELSADFIIMYNIAVLHNAERFIAFQNEDFLKKMIFLYKKYVDNNATHLIFKELFHYLDNLT